MSDKLTLYEKSNEYELNKIITNSKNKGICGGLGLACKNTSKNVILYLLIVIIAIVATISLVLNVIYTLDQNKNEQKNMNEEDIEYLKNTNIKYNKHGNLFVSNIIYK